MQKLLFAIAFCLDDVTVEHHDRQHESSLGANTFAGDVDRPTYQDRIQRRRYNQQGIGVDHNMDTTDSSAGIMDAPKRFIAKVREVVHPDPWFVHHKMLALTVVTTAVLGAVSAAMIRKGIEFSKGTATNAGYIVYGLTLLAENVWYFLIPINISTTVRFVQLAWALIFANVLAKEFITLRTLFGTALCMLGAVFVQGSYSPNLATLDRQEQAKFYASILFVAIILTLAEAWRFFYRNYFQPSPLLAALYATIGHYQLNSLHDPHATDGNMWMTRSLVLVSVCVAVIAVYGSVVMGLNTIMLAEFYPAYVAWMAFLGHIMVACGKVGDSVMSSVVWDVGIILTVVGLSFVVLPLKKNRGPKLVKKASLSVLLAIKSYERLA